MISSRCWWETDVEVSALEDAFGALHLCNPDIGENYEAYTCIGFTQLQMIEDCFQD